MTGRTQRLQCSSFLLGLLSFFGGIIRILPKRNYGSNVALFLGVMAFFWGENKNTAPFLGGRIRILPLFLGGIIRILPKRNYAGAVEKLSI